MSNPDDEPITEPLKEIPDPNETGGSAINKSKDIMGDDREGNLVTGRARANQNPRKGSDTSSKESETDADQWIFLDSVPDYMICRICMNVFQSPQLISCCGKTFVRSVWSVMSNES